MVISKKFTSASCPKSSVDNLKRCSDMAKGREILHKKECFILGRQNCSSSLDTQNPLIHTQKSDLSFVVLISKHIRTSSTKKALALINGK
jgi:hypothetical protein